MKVIITGASGLIGSALMNLLNEKGHQVVPLKRLQSLDNKPNQNPYWHVDSETVDFGDFKDADVVVHLAGKNIADNRWTDKVKQEIISSRVIPTELLIEYIKTLSNPPKAFICASAIGFYGDRGDELLDEESASGSDFVSDVCRQVEEVTEPLVDTETRLVNLRTGLVISPKGGAMKKMLPAFKMGLGGNMGSGNQYYSWISIDDMIAAILFIIENPDLKGAINMVAPNPLRNKEFTKELGSSLKRPTIFPMPAMIAKIMFGEMAEELLLSSTRVIPRKLQEQGYAFQHQHINQAFSDYFS